MKKAHLSDQIRMRFFAHLTAPVTVVKELPFAWKGEIKDALFERDLIPGLYGFMTLQRRDAFVKTCNSSSEIKPCFAVEIAEL